MCHESCLLSESGNLSCCGARTHCNSKSVAYLAADRSLGSMIPREYPLTSRGPVLDVHDDAGEHYDARSDGTACIEQTKDVEMHSCMASW